MSQIPSSQGAPQASNIAVQDALPLIGSPSRENGQSVLNSIDSTLAKLFEDRNVLLAEGGTLSWNTTSNNLTFSAALKLHINSQVAGGSPTVIDLTSTTRAFSADGRMLYAVIDRSLGTAAITADSATLPSVVAANQEVFLLAKRVGSDLYFRNGFKLVNKQTATLSGDHNESIANDASTGSAVTLASVNTGIVRVTNGSLVSIAGIPAGRTGQQLIVINATGTAITFLEENTGASASDRLYLGLNGAVTVLNQSAVIFTYDSTSSRWYAAGGAGSGSGSGFKNLLTEINSKFAGGVADWVTYDDGAVSSPVDGTGGSPSAITISGTSSGSEVLEGLQSLKIAKSAADGRGEGTSVLSKTIDRADRGKPFYVYFSYDATHANYVAGDLTVFAYDVTNSQLLTVYNDSNNGQLLQLNGRMSGVIYPQDTCTQIRLILHCTSTNASAWNVFLDEVVITPQANIVGPVMTDWIDAGTISVGAVTTPPTKGTVLRDKIRYRRVGSNAEIRMEYKQSVAGTAGSGDYLYTLPAGLTFDSSVTFITDAITTIDTANSIYSMYGTSGIRVDAGNSGRSGGILPYDATRFRIFFEDFNSQIAPQDNAFFQYSFAGLEFSVEFSVPISGWKAGASLTANDAGLQTVIAAVYRNAAFSTVGTTATLIPMDAVSNDPYSTSDGTGVVIPRSGRYKVIANGKSNSVGMNGIWYTYIFVNGSQVRKSGISSSGATSIWESQAIWEGSLNKGDTVRLYASRSDSGGGGVLTVGSVNDTSLVVLSVPDFNVFGVQGPIIVGAQTEWDSYTPTLTGFGSPTNISFRWRRLGSDMLIQGTFTAGTVSATTASVTIPSGYSIDSAKLSLSNTSAAAGPTVGLWTANTANPQRTNAVTATGTSTSLIYAGGPQSSTPLVPATGSGAFASSVVTAFEARVPILGWSVDTRLYPTQRIIGTTYLKDVKTSGTAAGTATSGSYQTRTLNTQEGDTGFCSLSSNQFTLEPGTYEIEAYAPAQGNNNADVGAHKIKIRNITDSSDAILGSHAEPDSTTNTATYSFSLLKGRIVVTSAKTFELQHRVSITKATDGFGSAASFGDSEVYSTVKIDKIY